MERKRVLSSTTAHDRGDRPLRQGARSQGGLGDAVLAGFGLLGLSGEGGRGEGEKEVQTPVEGARILQEQDVCGDAEVRLCGFYYGLQAEIKCFTLGHSVLH